MTSSDSSRRRHEADLMARCRAVRQQVWGDYLWTWSTGEAAAVAYILNDEAVLAELGEDEASVID